MNLLSRAPRTDTVVLQDIDRRPGDEMTFVAHVPPTDGERDIVWKAPNGQHILTVGFIDAHPWYPAHKTTVLLCSEGGKPAGLRPTEPADTLDASGGYTALSGDAQPGSQIGMVDHRGAAETWWRLTAPSREKWDAAISLLASIDTDDQGNVIAVPTPELLGILRLTLPWIPVPLWPGWCRKAFTKKAGNLVMADGSPIRGSLGKSPPAELL